MARWLKLPALAAVLLAVQGLPTTAALSAAAVAQAPSHGAFAGVKAAVDTCLAATRPNAIDPARLSVDGWTEQVIDNVEASPRPIRLFSKARSGALIMFNFADNGKPSCYLMVVRMAEGPEPLASALAAHLGGALQPEDGRLGPGAAAMRVPGHPFLLVLRRQPDDRDIMANIQIMPIEGS
ncbi:MAG TPA: hypothetical protein VGO55_01225 [Allosphingosinicella sp.]|jgi:hypothetical protein|nr:hypothetical protein [Allosphingosinicella sp.]